MVVLQHLEAVKSQQCCNLQNVELVNKSGMLYVAAFRACEQTKTL